MDLSHQAWLKNNTIQSGDESIDTLNLKIGAEKNSSDIGEYFVLTEVQIKVNYYTLTLPNCNKILKASLTWKKWFQPKLVMEALANKTI